MSEVRDATKRTKTLGRTLGIYSKLAVKYGSFEGPAPLFSGFRAQMQGFLFRGMLPIQFGNFPMHTFQEIFHGPRYGPLPS